jgi:zinc transporter ZupT
MTGGTAGTTVIPPGGMGGTAGNECGLQTFNIARRPAEVLLVLDRSFSVARTSTSAEVSMQMKTLRTLTLGALLGGIALGSAVLGEDTPRDLGLAVFLATVLHKPADSLTISTLLLKAGTSRQRTLTVQCFFALLIPLGVLLFQIGRSVLATQVDSAFTGCVLAFSAGTFICIALSDLLPEVQFHSHDRLRLFLAVIFGAALMWGTALVESLQPSNEPGGTKQDGPQLRQE